MLYIVLCLSILSLIGQYCYIFLHFDKHSLFVTQTDLNHERNIPTVYQYLSLLFSSFLLLLIAYVKNKTNDKYYKNWIILSCTFFYLALDELCKIHEQLNHPIKKTFHTT